ncbi:MAG TPA: hypothetical protein VKC60_16550 [Opitutaceae bacterium]|nr:hypothetical protein [Opitutaceae bacterium]
MAKAFPGSNRDPFGVKRLERSQAKTPAGYERLFNKVAREWGLGPPTRAEQRAVRAEARDQQLKPEQVDRNAYRHPVVCQRAPRDMPRRRSPGWAAANFVLPRLTIEGLTLLTKSMADRERAERSSEPYGFRRRYPKTKNYLVVKALNYLLHEHGLSQFCVEEAEPMPGRVRRFAIPTD